METDIADLKHQDGGEDNDVFPEVKLLLGRALRMSQRLHHPVPS